MIDATTAKPEKHDLSEVLRASTGGLEGSGSGKISVSGVVLGIGKNGEVSDSRSTWSMQDGTMRIDQDLKVKFKVLLFSKNFDVKAKFTGKRGSNIDELMTSARVTTGKQPA